jgi:hypothetical protein
MNTLGKQEVGKNKALFISIIYIFLTGCSDKQVSKSAHLLQAVVQDDIVYALISVESNEIETRYFSHSADVVTLSKNLFFISINISNDFEIDVLENKKVLPKDNLYDYELVRYDNSIFYKNLSSVKKGFCGNSDVSVYVDGSNAVLICDKKLKQISISGNRLICESNLPELIDNPENELNHYYRNLIFDIDEHKFSLLHNSSVTDESGIFHFINCDKRSKIGKLENIVKRVNELSTTSFLVLTRDYENIYVEGDQIIMKLPFVDKLQPIVDSANKRAFYFEFINISENKLELTIKVFEQKDIEKTIKISVNI